MKETLGRDINGYIDYSLPLCSAGTRTTLAADVEQTVVTPANYNRAFFSYGVGTNVWFLEGSVAVTIPGESFSSSKAELNPSIRQIDINGGQTLRFICDTNSYVQIRYDVGSP